MGGRPGYYICAPITHLWASYPDHAQLDDIVSHLEAKGRLSNGSWAGVPTTATTLTEWLMQTPVLRHFCSVFDDIQSFVLGERQSDTAMSYAGPSVPPHLQSSTAYPEAIFAARAKVGKDRNWADVICPFESAHHPEHIERVSTSQFQQTIVNQVNQSKSKVLWALERTLLCDVSRCFSFGVDVAGATFRIWFACRSSIFAFSFDWLEVRHPKNVFLSCSPYIGPRLTHSVLHHSRHLQQLRPGDRHQHRCCRRISLQVHLYYRRNNIPDLELPV